MTTMDRVVKALKEAPRSQVELVRLLNSDKGYINRCIRKLRYHEKIHITEYRHNKNKPEKVFTWGEGEDLKFVNKRYKPPIYSVAAMPVWNDVIFK